jgi:hypothetical protein
MVFYYQIWPIDELEAAERDCQGGGDTDRPSTSLKAYEGGWTGLLLILYRVLVVVPQIYQIDAARVGNRIWLYCGGHVYLATAL